MHVHNKFLINLRFSFLKEIEDFSNNQFNMKEMGGAHFDFGTDSYTTSENHKCFIHRMCFGGFQQKNFHLYKASSSRRQLKKLQGPHFHEKEKFNLEKIGNASWIPRLCKSMYTN